MSSDVLYDAPGPRARRITLIVSVVVTLAVVAGAYQLIYRPLADDGQFTMKEWGPLLNPGYEVGGRKAFPLVWQRIGEGWVATIKAAVLAIITSIIFGTGLALLRELLMANRDRKFAAQPAAAGTAMRALVFGGRVATRTWVEFFRGLPVVITIFFTFNMLQEAGVAFDDVLIYLVIGLTLYNGVVIGEILRSGMAGLPHGQREAAASVGLSPRQTTMLVLLPQAFRVMLPALISQLVVILKDTSLGFILSYEEALAVGKQLVLALNNPIPVFFTIGATYIVINYALSKLAQYVQRRMSASGYQEKEQQAAVVTIEADAAV
jgi:glutamate transport system permease protein